MQMQFEGSIIITDPCYLLKDKDWDYSKYGERLDKLGFTSYLSRSTIYGDWSCEIYKTTSKYPLKQLEKVRTTINNAYDKYRQTTYEVSRQSEDAYNLYKDVQNAFVKYEDIGAFCADSSMVCAVLLQDVMNYNPDFLWWLEEHSACGTIIEDFDGIITEAIINDKLSLVGSGNINFFTLQVDTLPYNE